MRRAALIVALVVVSGCERDDGPARTQAASQSVPEPVARVGDRLIGYSEIGQTREAAARLCKWFKSHQDSPEDCTEEEVTAQKAESEARQLAYLIKGTVRTETMESLGIRAKRGEIRNEWARFTAEWDERDLEELFQGMRVQLEAVNAVYEDGEDPNVVYERLMADSMSLTEWEMALETYRAKENRDAYAVFENPEDLRDLDLYDDAGMVGLVMERKLAAVIDDEIGRQDPRYVEHLEALDGHLVPWDLSQPDHAYVANARRRWWSKWYLETDIQILDVRFEGVLDRIGPMAETRDKG